MREDVTTMPFDPNKHKRRSIRLKGYDYRSSGVYFVTIVTQGRALLWADVCEGEVILSPAGEMVEQVWTQLPERFPRVSLDAFVVMPNHVHGLLVLGGIEPSSTALSDVVGAFKSQSTVNYTRGVREQGWSAFEKRVWQSNYFERILRNEEQLARAQGYIEQNPENWLWDHENPIQP